MTEHCFEPLRKFWATPLTCSERQGKLPSRAIFPHPHLLPIAPSISLTREHRLRAVASGWKRTWERRCKRTADQLQL